MWRFHVILLKFIYLQKIINNLNQMNEQSYLNIINATNGIKKKLKYLNEKKILIKKNIKNTEREIEKLNKGINELEKKIELSEKENSNLNLSNIFLKPIMFQRLVSHKNNLNL
jgi:predicted nuclease with TOPRIM domain